METTTREAVDELLQTYGETGGINYLDAAAHLPSRLAIEAAQNKKAAGITVLDLSDVGAFTSYFVICTGFSTPQVQAIGTEVEELLYKHLQRSPGHREGRRSAEWALLDFGSFVVHVFSEQARRFYDLERVSLQDMLSATAAVVGVKSRYHSLTGVLSDNACSC